MTLKLRIKRRILFSHGASRSDYEKWLDDVRYFHSHWSSFCDEMIRAHTTCRMQKKLWGSASVHVFVSINKHVLAERGNCYDQTLLQSGSFRHSNAPGTQCFEPSRHHCVETLRLSAMLLYINALLAHVALPRYVSCVHHVFRHSFLNTGIVRAGQNAQHMYRRFAWST